MGPDRTLPTSDTDQHTGQHTDAGAPGDGVDARLAADASWTDTRWRSDFRRRLLRWFDANQRTMPWRSDPQPYKVWISEIMCQQTQVATVIPYFNRFLATFPTISDLASADEQTLMQHWEGLGYYRRARSLAAAARRIVDEHGGVFPLDFDAVLALPGIGRYTAGAILSIADDQRLPILEGNTQRLFSRLFAVSTPTAETATNRLLWTISESLLPRRGAGTFNQAAMEIGALVCKPKSPECPTCPLRTKCAARRLGLQEQIPAKAKRVAFIDKDEFAFVVGDNHRGYLMRPLPDAGRWAGLWDFPRPVDDSIARVDAAAEWLESQLVGTSDDAELETQARGTRTRVDVGIKRQTLKHAVTKYRITLHVHHARIRQERTADPSDNQPAAPAIREIGPEWASETDDVLDVKSPWRFVRPEEFADLPLSTTGRKIADHILNNRQQTLDF